MTEKLNDHLPTTPDMQAERLAELKRLFPDLFDGEGQLKLDEVKQLVGDEQPSQERYDFSWYGKRKAKETAYTPTTATLTYDESRSVNPEKADGNVIIEGENLETLKTLLSAYREAIKCIYIDPPYNTGKDFVYSDNYTEDKRAYWEETGGLEKGIKVDTNPETAGRYHSNWLSMMYSRLLLARQLLKDDGVIFVSIDDKEVHNLRRLMDDVFGAENYVGCVVWKNVTDNNPTRINSEHEYILCFAREVSSLPKAWKGLFSDEKDILLEKYNELLAKHKNDIEAIEKTIREFISDNSAVFRFTSRYKFVDEDGVFTGSESVHNTKPDGYDFDIFHPTTKKPMKKPVNGYRFPESTYQEMHDSGTVIYGEDEKRIIKIKKYLKHYQETFRSLFVLDGRLGSYDLKRLDLGGTFSNTKPIDLFKHIISFCTDSNSNDLVLDFFSGSGGFGQAIVESNLRDSGNRRFILIQLPEQVNTKTSYGKKALNQGYKKISDITIERVKRVINGYGDDPKPLDTGFKVYQLTKSHFPRTEFKPDPEKSEAENIEVLKAYIKEKEKQLTGLFEPSDIQDEVLLKNGFKLNYKLSDVSEFKNNTVKLADDGEKQALLCLDSKLDPETVKQLIKKPQAFICLERSLSTDDKWNLRQHLKHKFIAF